MVPGLSTRRTVLDPLLIALALVVALLLVWWGVRSRSTQRSDAHHQLDNLDTVAAWPPQATRVLTSQERQAYDLLRTAFPAHMVLAQVPLQRFIKVPTRNSYAEWLRRVGHLSVDLAVCDRHSQIVAVVEVRTADEPLSGRAQRRADRLMKVLKAAQVPVHVWSTDALPSVDAAREAILPTPPEPAPLPLSAIRSAPGRPAATKPGVLAEESAAADEPTEVREPPPSTWFDDLDTGPVPLPHEPPLESQQAAKNRPAR